METIKINKSSLEIRDNDSLSSYTIIKENGSGLYTVLDENGDKQTLTRDEVKKMGDINLVDETLELLKCYEFGRDYTEDGLNFIDESEYNKLPDKYKEDYERVEFEVIG